MRNFIHRIVFVVICCLALPTTGVAGESSRKKAPQEVVTLDQVRAYALVHSLQSRQIDRDLGRDLADALQIQQLSNPTLSIDVDLPVSYDGERPENEIAVSLEQTYRISDLKIRSTVSTLIRNVSGHRKQQQLQKLAQKISLGYYRLWALRQKKLRVKEQQKTADRIVKILSDAALQGVSSNSEVKIAVASKATLKADLLGLDQELHRTERLLTKLAAVNLRNRELKKPDDIALKSYAEVLIAARNSEQSIGQRVELHLSLAREQLELAKRDRYPSFTPKLSYSRNDDGADFVGIGFSVPLPLFNRNEVEIEKSKSDVSYQRRQHQYVHGPEFEVELKALYDQVSTQIEQARVYENEVLPPLTEGLRLSEEAFKNAQIPLLQLWDVQARYQEAIDRSTELWIDAFGGLTELSLLCGELQL